VKKLEYCLEREFCDINSSLDMIRISICRRLQWAGHVARMLRTGMYVEQWRGRPFGKVSLEVQKGNLMKKFTVDVREKGLQEEGGWDRHRICPVDGVGHAFGANAAKLISAV
jgi:hypothetical protein